MTQKALLVYYSATGNTRSVAETFDTTLVDIIEIKEIEKVKLYDYSIIIIGMSTWQRGMPPKLFQREIERFKQLKNKIFYFFGSGRSEYEFFCGGLDVYYEIMKQRNKVNTPLKFEGYPSPTVWETIEKWQQEIYKQIKLGELN